MAQTASCRKRCLERYIGKGRLCGAGRVALFLCCHRRRGARQSSRIAAGIAPSAPVPPRGRGPPGAPRQHSSSAQRDARGPRGAGAAGERRAQRSPAAASARAVSAQQGPFADALASFETRAPVVRAGDPTRPASGQKVNKSNQSGPPLPLAEHKHPTAPAAAQLPRRPPPTPVAQISPTYFLPSPSLARTRSTSSQANPHTYPTRGEQKSQDPVLRLPASSIS